MNFRSFIMVFLSFLLAGQLNGQIADSSFVLEEVVIASEKGVFQGIGGNETTWDRKSGAMDGNRSVAEVLANSGEVYVKNYGPGSLSTTSVQGGGSAHTLFVWNGLPLSSPMSGQLDFALVPVFAGDEISLSAGGSSSTWGSGAIGGVVELKNRPDFSEKKALEVSMGQGSFGTFEGRLIAKVGNKKLQSTTRLFTSLAQNDFSYEPYPGLDFKNAENADFTQSGLVQSLAFRPNMHHHFSASWWGQTTEKGIPPTLTQNASFARQADKSSRFSGEWKWVRSKMVWSNKVGFFAERQNYLDPNVLDVNNDYNSWVGESRIQGVLNKELNGYAGFNMQRTAVFSENFEGLTVQNNLGLNVGANWEKKTTAIHLGLRQSYSDGLFAPIAPLFGIEQKLGKALLVKGKLSRDFRWPTLNDLHWVPGGNLDLKPESGWSETFSILGNHRIEKLDFNWEINAFNRVVDNWILWARLPDNPFFSPENIARVWSRGLSPKIALNWERNGFGFGIKGSYQYTLSTNQTTIELPKIEAGTQIYYSPIHQGFSKITLGYKPIKLNYTAFFTGKVLGINGEVAGYHTQNVGLAYTQKIKQNQLRFFFNTNNIFNKQYQVVENRPMPGRSFQLGLSVNVLKTN